jgi:hypothetical protein
MRLAGLGSTRIDYRNRLFRHLSNRLKIRCGHCYIGRQWAPLPENSDLNDAGA